MNVMTNKCLKLIALSSDLLSLQEAEHAMPGSVYYSEYIYAPASSQISYDVAAAALPENVQAENSVA